MRAHLDPYPARIGQLTDCNDPVTLHKQITYISTMQWKYILKTLDNNKITYLPSVAHKIWCHLKYKRQ